MIDFKRNNWKRFYNLPGQTETKPLLNVASLREGFFEINFLVRSIEQVNMKVEI